MGNISSMARASTALDSYVSELGNDISYEKSLSSSRFLKSIVARHVNGPLVLKIFIKPDSSMTLRIVQKRLKAERDALADVHNVYTYQTFVETEKAGYLIRQWVGSSLYDRLSTQPYLAEIEKKWIAFQLLTCLRDARIRKIAHGDIKSDNVLITSDLTVLVTDFSSSFKPTYLPLDDPSDFSFYFDTSARRTCYIAPERFYAADSKIAQSKATAQSDPAAGGEAWEKRDGRVTEEMDVFSVGCVLAEIWTDGRTVFNLSELYAYRNGSVGLEGILDNLENADVKAMIAEMLSRNPTERPSFDRILTTYRGSIFPEYYYTFLKDYVNEISELPDIAGSMFVQRAASQPGTRIDSMLEQWDSISVHLEGKEVDENGPALLLLNIVTSSIRNSLSPSSRLHGLQLFRNLCPFLLDEDIVDRIVPFIVELLADEASIVRAEACRTLVTVVESVSSITPQNATYIPEYLLPQTRRLATDVDVFVRATYARALVRLADAAVKMLEMSQIDWTMSSETTGLVESDYDAMLFEIQSVVEEQATTLLVDPSSHVKRAMLSSIAELCLFFGRQKSSETVLSHIMTYLNDRDWHLRLAFFDGIVAVGAFIGIRAIDEYVLPLMLQALADPEETVVARVIGSLSSLASLGLLSRMRLWDVVSAVQGFLYHPNTWIRHGTAGFIAAAARNLPSSDTWCILYPAVRKALRADILSMDEDSILSSLVPPLSRATMSLAKAAALQNSPHGFWSSVPNRSNAKSMTKSAIVEGSQLKDRGISSRDEKKIWALRDFIFKQAHASRARQGTDPTTPPEALLTSGKAINLADLGVTPQTVFISPRTVGVVDATLELKRLRAESSNGPSRRTSFASRSNRGTVENPLDEIRKRLATLEPPSRTTTDQTLTSERSMPNPDASPSDSVMSSTLDLANVTRANRRKVDNKAAPAISAVHTNAVGTTTIHDESRSGRTTPLSSTPRGPLAPYGSTYDGRDPGVRAFLEQIDLENYREPLLDFGPRVIASHRKRGPRTKSAGPQFVTMIAHLPQHTGAVTAMVTSPDQLFFATASEDSLIMIWDIPRLERTVSARPRLSYRMDAPITTMCRIEETHCLAAATEDGQVYVLRVHVSSNSTSAKYRSIDCIRAWRADAADGIVTHLSHLNESSLLVITNVGVIAVLDMRTMEIKARFQHPLELGLISTVCVSTHWIIVGTVSGALSLWDLRFGLLLKSWSARGGITSCVIHPSRGRGKWIMVSVAREVDGPVVEVYDIETSKLVEQYEVRMTRPSSRAPALATDGGEVVKTKSQLIAELASGHIGFHPSAPDSERPPSVEALLIGQGFASLPYREDESLSGSAETRTGGGLRPGWMVTAGEDRVIRYWDLAKPTEGFIICGSQREKDVMFKQGNATNPATFYTVPNPHRQTTQFAELSSRHAANSQRQPLRPHYDAICALAAVETPFSSCIISADRSGVIKVWRMEGSASSAR